MPPNTDLLDLERELGIFLADFLDDQAYICNYIPFRFLVLLFSVCLAKESNRLNT